jgi:DNA-binding PadR family transcriptional regulator
LQTGELCSYISLRKSDKIDLKRSFGRYPNFHQSYIAGRPLSNGERVDRLKEILKEVYNCAKTKKRCSLRAIVDFGHRFDLKDVDSIMDLEEDIRKASPVTFMNAFNLKGLDQEITSKLFKFHDRAIVSTKDMATLCFPASSRHEGLPIDVVSKETIEQCVKKSFDVIVLSMLLRGPTCGFDVIKALVQNFGVLLSQGTVYPYLYSMEDKGYVKTEIESDNKTKVYRLTEPGRRMAKKKISEHALAQRRILETIFGEASR